MLRESNRIPKIKRECEAFTPRVAVDARAHAVAEAQQILAGVCRNSICSSPESGFLLQNAMFQRKTRTRRHIKGLAFVIREVVDNELGVRGSAIVQHASRLSAARQRRRQIRIACDRPCHVCARVLVCQGMQAHRIFWRGQVHSSASIGGGN